jgi:hypothetical protein
MDLLIRSWDRAQCDGGSSLSAAGTGLSVMEAALYPQLVKDPVRWRELLIRSWDRTQCEGESSISAAGTGPSLIEGALYSHLGPDSV